ncbi:helix-turn-helix domain-containing protein [Nonomuraea sp. NPDC059194]|uniref:helix-turn-helix domain-containing protein n=1 Tax=Nonomuraea sp. NPDC059194 TaxID=3346764 RepID=UPI003678B507
MQRISPPLRQQRLASILRDLRETRSLSRDEVAARLGWAAVKVWRIETGKTRPSVDDASRLTELYGAGLDVRELCERLARQASGRPWWAPYRSVLGEYVAFETEAVLIRTWEPLLIPGLLQTEDYARAVHMAAHPDEPADVINLRVKARMTRHRLLLAETDPTQFTAVISEGALRQRVGGPSTMAAQLRRIVDVGERPNVNIYVLPADIGAHPGLEGSFVLLSLPGHEAHLFVETGVSEVITDKVELVRDYERRFDWLASKSMPPDRSMAFIAEIEEGCGC